MPSMDVVSELEVFEVNHAVQNTVKEIATRFDFRGSEVKVDFNEKNKEIKLSAESDFQVDVFSTGQIAIGIGQMEWATITIRRLHKYRTWRKRFHDLPHGHHCTQHI